jgi:CxxC motif-containing protein (DUF1111 family)
MSPSATNHNEHSVGSLSNGTVIDYNFTYLDLGCSCAQDSPAAVYVHASGGLPSPADMAASPDLGVPPAIGTPYPTPIIPAGPTTGGDNLSATVVPLYSSSTALEPATVVDSGAALVTRVGDRVRDRHAREAVFHIYDHFLPRYFEDRTFGLEIVDTVAKGGSAITLNVSPVHPLDTPNVRAFFRGITTVAEYFYNGDLTPVNDSLYTATITYNAKENREIRVGDRMELEVGIFLRAPIAGRFNYYSSVWLYVVGSGGIVPFEGVGSTLDSYPMAETGWSGGRTTLNAPYSNEPDKRFMQLATNLSPRSAQPWVEGRRLFHTDFGNGAHSEPDNPVFAEQANKVGGHYVVRSCTACHVNDGRSLPPDVGATITQMAVKVGEVAGGMVSPHPQLGTTLQPFNADGASEGSAQLSGWIGQSGTFDDGTPYQLRRPTYAGTGTIPAYYSMRNTPALVGLGLLEAVPESAIAALVDVDDGDGDGVSGRMQVVPDRATGLARMGRFGWKAAQPNLTEQIATALNRDMGVKSSSLMALDCGVAETTCASAATPISDGALAELVRYVALLGVPARRSLGDADALAGEALFASAGCTSCHRATLTTSSFHPFAELRSQTIHPYTDLLVHDMGPGLADNLPEAGASGQEWRTAPLWGIGLTAGVSGGEAYLHDGRARSLSEAILWHDGEGRRAKLAFARMSATERAALLAFLASL